MPLKMAEYDIAFAKRLADMATEIVSDGINACDSYRAVLYLALLSCEITLKALLEKAGTPISDIRGRSHSLKLLLEDIDKCKVEVEIAPGIKRWRYATRLRAVTVDDRFRNATVGTMLQAEDAGASKYPNQIRYGNILNHYSADLIAKLAHAIYGWANRHWDTIRVI